MVKWLTVMFLSCVQVQATFYGDDYYNDRYSAHGIAYTISKWNI